MHKYFFLFLLVITSELTAMEQLGNGGLRTMNLAEMIQHTPIITTPKELNSMKRDTRISEGIRILTSGSILALCGTFAPVSDEYRMNAVKSGIILTGYGLLRIMCLDCGETARKLHRACKKGKHYE